MCLHLFFYEYTVEGRREGYLFICPSLCLVTECTFIYLRVLPSSTLKFNVGFYKYNILDRLQKLILSYDF